MPKLFSQEGENVPFLNSNEVADGDVVEFINQGKLTTDRWSDNRLQIDVKLPDGEIRRVTVNKTSQKNLIMMYSPDTASWVGCKARITKPTLLIGGKLKTVIILYPVE